MRRAITLATVLLSVAPLTAQAQTFRSSVQGFGGMTFGTSSILGTASGAPALGGVFTTALSPNVHVVGEVGRLSDIQPSLYDLVELTPAEFDLSAWYWEGGVRFVASPNHAVRPYAEATAGFAKMKASLTGFGDRVDPFVNASLQFLNRNEPLLGVGTGILIEHGPLSVDLGYRYKKITAGGLASYINEGDAYQINEMRFGIGVRF
jgi:opacity protein-like surface antigen